MRPYRNLTSLLALTMIGLGLVMLALTIVRGGGAGSVGILVGLLFVVAGAGRLYLMRRSA